MKILNLFAGIGGNRTLWGDEHEITAVEIDPEIAEIYKKRFPNDKMIIQDVYEYLEKHYFEYDFIWASPPCPTHSRLCTLNKKKSLPDMKLYSIILFLKQWFRGDYIIENVKPYYKFLIKPSFILGRHVFWSNKTIQPKRFDYASKVDKSKFLGKKQVYGRRGYQDFTVEELCRIHHVPIDLIKNGLTSRKNKVLRNCVLPEVGKYILDNLQNKSILHFI